MHGQDIVFFVVSIESELQMRLNSCIEYDCFRFCSHDYYPFDARDIKKYVVGDDYTPVWEVLYRISVVISSIQSILGTVPHS